MGLIMDIGKFRYNFFENVFFYFFSSFTIWPASKILTTTRTKILVFLGHGQVFLTTGQIPGCYGQLIDYGIV